MQMCLKRVGIIVIIRDNNFKRWIKGNESYKLNHSLGLHMLFKVSFRVIHTSLTYDLGVWFSI